LWHAGSREKEKNTPKGEGNYLGYCKGEAGKKKTRCMNMGGGGGGGGRGGKTIIHFHWPKGKRASKYSFGRKKKD